MFERISVDANTGALCLAHILALVELNLAVTCCLRGPEGALRSYVSLRRFVNPLDCVDDCVDWVEDAELLSEINKV